MTESPAARPPAGPAEDVAPRLSICLSTFNRAALVWDTLATILPQLGPDVELVLVDAGSTDETPEVARRAASSSPYVRCVRLPDNLGFDRDFCKAVELARGEYCWLFADDDLIDAGAVGRVKGALAGGPDLVIVNGRAGNVDLSRMLKDPVLDMARDEAFGPAELDGLFLRIVPYVSFVGCVIVRRQLWMERKKDLYFGTEFVHVAAIFQAPLPRGARVLARAEVTLRCGNSLWSPRAVEVWLKRWPKLLLSFDCVSEHVRRQRAHLWTAAALKSLAVYRGVGSCTAPALRSLTRGENVPLLWRVLARAVALMPPALVNALLLAYCRIFRQEEWFTIHELSTSRHNWFRRTRPSAS